MPQVEVPSGTLHTRLRARLEALVEVAHSEHQAVIAQWRRVSSIQETLVLLCRCAGVDPGELALEETDRRLKELEAIGDDLREFRRTIKGPTTRHGRWQGTWGLD